MEKQLKPCQGTTISTQVSRDTVKYGVKQGFLKTPFAIMVVGSGQSPLGEYLENENTMPVRKHNRCESRYDSLRIWEVRSLLPRLYASYSLQHAKQSGTVSSETSCQSRNKESHRVPAIALTRIVSQAPATHPGALVVTH